MSGDMSVAEAGKRGGEAKTPEKIKASVANGRKPKGPRRRRIETLLDKKE